MASAQAHKKQGSVMLIYLGGTPALRFPILTLNVNRSIRVGAEDHPSFAATQLYTHHRILTKHSGLSFSLLASGCLESNLRFRPRTKAAFTPAAHKTY